MAWIKTVDESEAKGIVKQVYDGIKQKLGRVSPVFQALSLKPDSMRGFALFVGTIHFGASSLTHVHENLIAILVSTINKCGY